MHHPHLHCVVPGGGLSPDGNRWIPCKPGFFLPVRVLSHRFRRLFLEYLQNAFDRGKLQFFNALESLRDRRQFARYLAPLVFSSGSRLSPTNYALSLFGKLPAPPEAVPGHREALARMLLNNPRPP